MRRYMMLSLCMLLAACNGSSLNTLADNLPKHPQDAVLLGDSEMIVDRPGSEPSVHPVMMVFESRCLHPNDPGFAILTQQQPPHGDLPRGNFATAVASTLHFKDYSIVPAIDYAFDHIDVDHEEEYVIGGWYMPSPVSLSVKPGEILYIGHTVFEYKDKVLHARTEDRFDEYAKAHPIPPAWKGRIEKRFFHLPPTIPLTALTHLKKDSNVCR